MKGDFAEVVANNFRVGLEATLGFDSHGTFNPDGTSQLQYVTQFGRSIVLTGPKSRVKVLVALLHGFASWDQP